MTEAEKAVKILKLYAIENNTIVRSTSDLSPLEEWLLSKLVKQAVLELNPISKPSQKDSWFKQWCERISVRTRPLK